MTRLLILTLAIVFTASVQGQAIDKRIHRQVDSLKISGVDTFLIYSLACNGGLISLDSCSYEETKYLFWMKNSDSYIKRFDYCKSYKPVLLDRTNPLLFYFAYKSQIDKEEIKPPTYMQSQKNKNVTTSTIQTMHVDHDCFHVMTFLLKNKEITKEVSSYNKAFKNFDDGKRNMYYSHNQDTKLKAFIDQITKLINQFDTNNNFKAE